MEKAEILKIYDDYKLRFEAIKKVINPTESLNRIKEFDDQMGAPDFWSDQRAAQKIISACNILKDKLEKLKIVQDHLEELEVLIELDDEEMYLSSDKQINNSLKELNDLEIEMLLSEEFDSNNAIISLHPGSGGTESQDWALMLYRMYKRYAERHNFSFELIDYEDGQEAGLKSCTFSISGPFAYGLLKSENGVHRLVRISPFDSSARRHTSFASCMVIPQVDDTITIEINENDVRVDTYHSNGAGGQHINKTDSAVRLTHIPTGIVVCSQSQRSQIQNREKAWQVLKARLYQRELEIKAKQKQDVVDSQGENGWGSQIRSYVLHPYSMVKDHRTNIESSNPSNVLDGDLDDFIDAYLHFIKQSK